MGKRFSLIIFYAIIDGIMGQLWLFEYADHRFKETCKVNERTKQCPIFGMEVCYNELGCFRRDGDMKHFVFLPNRPDTIKTTFNYFTRKTWNKSRVITYNNVSTLPEFNTLLTIVFITHGFAASGDDIMIGNLKNALLSLMEIDSVIIVDWENGARGPNYLQAASNTQVVARQIVKLTNILIETQNINPLNIHLIGVSLGAQLSGFAGRWAQSNYNFKFGRISALDAAAPGFENYGMHVNGDDAYFVDAIHTSGGYKLWLKEFGMVKPFAHVDFFPNGGRKQPHCDESSDLNCNHLAAVDFFEQSIRHSELCPFTSYYSDSWDDYVKGKLNADNKSRMGYFSFREKGTSKQYLTTKKLKPYC